MFITSTVPFACEDQCDDLEWAEDVAVDTDCRGPPDLKSASDSAPRSGQTWPGS